MNPLPAAWATPHGWTPPRAGKDLRPLSARRADQKAQALRVAAEGAKAPAVSGEAAGLVKKGTSQTEPLPPTAREVAREQYDATLAALDQDVVVIDPTEARLRRMSRTVKFAAKVHAESTDLPSAMFTLTHRPGQTPEARDVARFIDCLKKWVLRKFGQRHLRYVWVAETQSGRAAKGDKGSVHYHVAVWLPPELKRRGEAMAARNSKLKASGVLPKPDKKGWWKKGSTERDWVRKSVRSYLSKYLSKGDAGAFPRGLRIHGAGGFNALETIKRRHHALPSWLRKEVTPEERWGRIQGGWMSKETGEKCGSPWRCILQGACIKLVRITEWNWLTVREHFEASQRLALA